MRKIKSDIQWAVNELCKLEEATKQKKKDMVNRLLKVKYPIGAKIRYQQVNGNSSDTGDCIVVGGGKIRSVVITGLRHINLSPEYWKRGEIFCVYVEHDDGTKDHVFSSEIL